MRIVEYPKKKGAGKTILNVLGIVAILVAGCVIYFSYNPVESVYFPKCPFLMLTGLKCPGCGSQRAIHALLHLDIRSAFHHNALLVLSLPYILILLTTKILLNPTTSSFFSFSNKILPHFSNILQHPNIIWSYFISVLFFWIARNISGF